MNYSIPNIGKSPVFQMNLGSVESAGSEVGLQTELGLWSEAQAAAQWGLTQTLDQTGSDLVALTRSLASLGLVFSVAQRKTCIQGLPLPSAWHSAVRKCACHYITTVINTEAFMLCPPVLVKENSSTQQLLSSPALNAGTHYLEW